MGNISIAIQHAKTIALDNGYGYSQERRDWPKEDDCSTVVMDSLKAAGYNTGSATYTGNMLFPLMAAGFLDVTASVNLRTGAGLQAGDIVLRPKTSTRGGHTAIMISATQLVQAQGDLDGKPGDSSGREIYIRDYYDSPFTYVLRDPAAKPVDCPYAEPVKDYKSPQEFFGNDSKWFKWHLNRIGYKFDLALQVGPETWKALNYEIGKAGQPCANDEFRSYLKSVPSR
ncbi:MAG: peptidoglycan amidohydrolase family protein [Eubacteriales bacterium]